MDQTRRDVLRAIALGAGGLGLRGLLGGLPASLLAAGRAAAQSTDPCDASLLAGSLRRQRLVLITSQSGDPLNANVPGCYVDGVYHPTAAGFSTADHGTFPVADAAHGCAAPWAALGDHPAIGPHLCFFHHGTYTVAHGDHAKVNAYMGAIRRGEMLCALIAKHVHGCEPKATTQAAPALLSENLIRYSGAVLPVLDRNGLAAILSQPAAGSRQERLRSLRDQDQRALHDLLWPAATPAQRTALDGYLQAQSDARLVDPQMVGSIADGHGTRQEQLNSTAAVLLAMNLAPVVVMSYDFGGDNHRNDYNLGGEAAATTASVAALADLWQKLSERNLQDDVTIVLQYVFGRTLGAAARAGSDLNGRDHNAAHHCTVIIGKGFSRSVIGGIQQTSGGDFRARELDSRSGLATDGGDVPYLATLASVGKTICAGMGLSRAVIEDQITAGKVVEAALAPDLRVPPA